MYISPVKVPWCSRINRNIFIQVWISHVCVSYIYIIWSSFSLFKTKLPFFCETAQAAHPTCSWKTQILRAEESSENGWFTHLLLPASKCPCSDVVFFFPAHASGQIITCQELSKHLQGLLRGFQDSQHSIHLVKTARGCDKKKRSLPYPLLENHPPKPPDAIRALSMGGGAGSWQIKLDPIFWPQDELLDLHVGWVSNH